MDSGYGFYETYKTKDGKYMAVGALEPHFFAELVAKLEIPNPEDFSQFGSDPDDLKARLSEIFLSKNRDEWVEIFDGSDACVTPVMTLEEAPHHPHNKSRESFIQDTDGEFSPVRSVA